MVASIELDGAVAGCRDAASYERVTLGRAAAAGRAVTLLRRRPAQPSRRAVLHVQGADDPVPAALERWFTERAFNVFLVQVRLTGRRSGRVRPAPADLDAACAQLRDAEGMHHVVVTAGGASAHTAAVWSDARQCAAADALILFAPAFPRRGLALSIDCPVLVVSHLAAGPPGLLRRRGRPVPPACLGGHVTWRQLPEAGGWPSPAGDANPRAVLAEVGRWLGAYMYGRLHDQLI